MTTMTPYHREALNRIAEDHPQFTMTPAQNGALFNVAAERRSGGVTVTLRQFLPASSPPRSACGCRSGHRWVVLTDWGGACSADADALEDMIAALEVAKSLVDHLTDLASAIEHDPRCPFCGDACEPVDDFDDAGVCCRGCGCVHFPGDHTIDPAKQESTPAPRR